MLATSPGTNFGISNFPPNPPTKTWVINLSKYLVTQAYFRWEPSLLRNFDVFSQIFHYLEFDIGRNPYKII